MFNKKEKGFTLIELIVSIFILIVAIIGIYNNFYIVREQTIILSYNLTASYLAEEALEITRNIRDNNWISLDRDWSEGLLNCQLGCQLDYYTGKDGLLVLLTPFAGDGNLLGIDEFGIYGYDKEDAKPTPFKRKVIIIPENDNILKVTAKIIWDYKGKESEFQAEEYLYDWY